jgi:hypothetical protein
MFGMPSPNRGVTRDDNNPRLRNKSDLAVSRRVKSDSHAFADLYVFIQNRPLNPGAGTDMYIVEKDRTLHDSGTIDLNAAR